MPKKHKFYIRCFYCVKKGKKGECSAWLWSFNFLSRLTRAANGEQFRQDHFCREVHQGCLPQDKNDSDKTVHNLQLTSAWIRRQKTRTE